MDSFLLKFLISIFISGLVLFSCQYEPDETFIKEVDPPDLKGPFPLDIVEYEDTIFITKKSSENIYFDYENLNKRLYDVKASIQNIKIPVNLDEPLKRFNVNIDKSLFEQTYYSLNLELSFYSNSKSLASKLEAELFTLSYEIPVVFDYAPPSPVNITRAYLENGNLKLEWEPYRRYGFSKYFIERRFWNPGSSSPEVTIFQITEKNKNSFLDPGFLGKNSEYTIYTIDELDRISEKTTYKVEELYNANLNASIANDKIEISWSENPFLNNLSFINVSKGYESHTINDHSQSSFMFDYDGLIFLGHQYFGLEFYPKESSNYSGRIPEKYILKYSEQGQEIIPNMIKARYNPLNDVYYSIGIEDFRSYGGCYIKTMNANSYEVIASKFLGQGYYYDFRQIITKNTEFIYVYDSQKEFIYEFNSKDLSLINSYNLKEITNTVSFESPITNDDLPMSDTKVIFLEDHQNKKLLLVDLDERELVGEFGYYYDMLSGISPDGTLFIVNDSIYSLDLDKKSYEFEYRLYRNDTENDEVYFSDKYIVLYDANDLRLIVYDINTGKEVFSEVFNSNGVSFDPYSNIIIMVSLGQSMKLIDLENGFTSVEHKLGYVNSEYAIINGMIIHLSEFEGNYYATYVKVK